MNCVNNFALNLYNILDIRLRGPITNWDDLKIHRVQEIRTRQFAKLFCQEHFTMDLFSINNSTNYGKLA